MITTLVDLSGRLQPLKAELAKFTLEVIGLANTEPNVSLGETVKNIGAAIQAIDRITENFIRRY